jgi:hypothetical protein
MGRCGSDEYIGRVKRCLTLPGNGRSRRVLRQANLGGKPLRRLERGGASLPGFVPVLKRAERTKQSEMVLAAFVPLREVT